jgi:glycosyltransferase involved in cell wall biosynthesis
MGKEKPVVSLITVSYNSERTISDTVESILKQTYENIEYIIIDGLSSDNTVKTAKSYASLLREKGYGFKIVSEKDMLALCPSRLYLPFRFELFPPFLLRT